MTFPLSSNRSARLVWRRSRAARGAGAGQVREDGLHAEGAVGGRNDAQPAATAGTGQDKEERH